MKILRVIITIAGFLIISTGCEPEDDLDKALAEMEKTVAKLDSIKQQMCDSLLAAGDTVYAEPWCK